MFVKTHAFLFRLTIIPMKSNIYCIRSFSALKLPEKITSSADAVYITFQVPFIGRCSIYYFSGAIKALHYRKISYICRGRI